MAKVALAVFCIRRFLVFAFMFNLASLNQLLLLQASMFQLIYYGAVKPFTAVVRKPEYFNEIALYIMSYYIFISAEIESHS